MNLFVSPELKRNDQQPDRDWLDDQMAGSVFRRVLGGIDAVFVTPMPKTPALIQAGCTFLHRGQTCSATGVGAEPRLAVLRMAAEVCEIRAERDRPDPLAGYGASESVGAARTHAMLELIERRSVRAWWSGQLLATEPTPDAIGRFKAACKRWPTKPAKAASLLCVEAESFPPAFVAWSCDPGGFGFVFGAACRLSKDDAIPAALRELRQMEFSLDLSARRSAAGHVLNTGEQARLARATRLDTRSDARLQAHSQSANRSCDAPDDATFIAQTANDPDLCVEPLTPPDASIHVCRATSRNAGRATVADDPYCAF